MFKAILRLIVFHIFCRRLVCSNVIFSDLSRSHFGSCVRDLLTFLFTSVDCAIRSQVYLSVLPNVWFWHFSSGMTLWQTWCLACTMTTCQGGQQAKMKIFQMEIMGPPGNHQIIFSENINCKTLPFHLSEADCSLYSPCWLLTTTCCRGRRCHQ